MLFKFSTFFHQIPTYTIFIILHLSTTFETRTELIQSLITIHVPYGDVGWIEFGHDDDTSARIAVLAEKIAHHSHLYYNLATPEISDAEFDALWDELKSLDSEHPQLRRVGAPIPPGSVKVDHRFPMRSLGKATDDQEIDVRCCRANQRSSGEHRHRQEVGHPLPQDLDQP